MVESVRLYNIISWLYAENHGCSHVFPAYSSARQSISKDSALAKLKAKRSALRALEMSNI